MRVADGQTHPVVVEPGEAVAAPHGIPTLTQGPMDAGTDPDEHEGRGAGHGGEPQRLQPADEVMPPGRRFTGQLGFLCAGGGGADGDARAGRQRGHGPVGLLLGEESEE